MCIIPWSLSATLLYNGPLMEVLVTQSEKLVAHLSRSDASSSSEASSFDLKMLCLLSLSSVLSAAISYLFPQPDFPAANRCRVEDCGRTMSDVELVEEDRVEVRLVPLVAGAGSLIRRGRDGPAVR